MSEKSNFIPEMTDPLSRYWKQPDRESIRLDNNNAYMSWDTAMKLADYTGSMPTGAYTGKMWRNGDWLVWFGKEIEGYVYSHFRRIVILEN